MSQDTNDEDQVINQGVPKFSGTKSIKQLEHAKTASSAIIHDQTIKKRKGNSDQSEINNSKCVKPDKLSNKRNKEMNKKTNFDWSSAVHSILAKRIGKDKEGLKIKTLRKKLIKRYISEIDNHADSEKIEMRVTKKLQKLQHNFNVSSDGKRISTKLTQ